MYLKSKRSSKNYKIQFFSNFVEFTAEQVSNSFLGGDNFLEPHVFGISNSIPYGLEESGESRSSISWVLG